MLLSAPRSQRRIHADQKQVSCLLTISQISVDKRFPFPTVSVPPLPRYLSSLRIAAKGTVVALAVALRDRDRFVPRAAVRALKSRSTPMWRRVILSRIDRALRDRKKVVHANANQKRNHRLTIARFPLRHEPRSYPMDEKDRHTRAIMPAIGALPHHG